MIISETYTQGDATPTLNDNEIALLPYNDGFYQLTKGSSRSKLLNDNLSANHLLIGNDSGKAVPTAVSGVLTYNTSTGFGFNSQSFTEAFTGVINDGALAGLIRPEDTNFIQENTSITESISSAATLVEKISEIKNKVHKGPTNYLFNIDTNLDFLGVTSMGSNSFITIEGATAYNLKLKGKSVSTTINTVKFQRASLYSDSSDLVVTLALTDVGAEGSSDKIEEGNYIVISELASGKDFASFIYGAHKINTVNRSTNEVTITISKTRYESPTSKWDIITDSLNDVYTSSPSVEITGLNSACKVIKTVIEVPLNTYNFIYSTSYNGVVYFEDLVIKGKTGYASNNAIISARSSSEIFIEGSLVLANSIYGIDVSENSSVNGWPTSKLFLTNCNIGAFINSVSKINSINIHASNCMTGITVIGRSTVNSNKVSFTFCDTGAFITQDSSVSTNAALDPSSVAINTANRNYIAMCKIGIRCVDGSFHLNNSFIYGSLWNAIELVNSGSCSLRCSNIVYNGGLTISLKNSSLNLSGKDVAKTYINSNCKTSDPNDNFDYKTIRADGSQLLLDFVDIGNNGKGHNLYIENGSSVSCNKLISQGTNNAYHNIPGVFITGNSSLISNEITLISNKMQIACTNNSSFYSEILNTEASSATEVYVQGASSVFIDNIVGNGIILTDVATANFVTQAYGCSSVVYYRLNSENLSEPTLGEGETIASKENDGTSSITFGYGSGRVLPWL